jgi:hypothetical protein
MQLLFLPILLLINVHGIAINLDTKVTTLNLRSPIIILQKINVNADIAAP